MILKFKKLSDKAKIPFYASEGAAGLDLTAIGMSDDGNNIVYDTGLAVQIPEGHLGFLMPRSSTVKKNLLLGNSVGLVDSRK